jgi:TPR repeat protein
MREWYTWRARQGSLDAANHLVAHYGFGEFDKNQWVLWALVAADLGGGDEQYRAAKILEAISDSPARIRQARQMLQRAADSGHPRAGSDLARSAKIRE